MKKRSSCKTTWENRGVSRRGIIAAIVVAYGLFCLRVAWHVDVMTRTTTTDAADVPVQQNSKSMSQHSFHSYEVHREQLMKNRSREELASLSNVQYFACCGLGHRLIRQADAWYLAKKINFGLRSFWGFCDKLEVFSYLFGHPRPEDLEHVTSKNLTLKIVNERKEFGGIYRLGSTDFEQEGACICQGLEDRFESDRELYQQLRSRFLFRDESELFMRNLDFGNHTVIGMHLRAGNNETGDFEAKKRSFGMENIDQWVDNMCEHVKKIVSRRDPKYPPLLFIATDTPSLVGVFRAKLAGILPVIDFQQKRKEDGVFFGTTQDMTKGGDDCLRGWVDAINDIYILSSADLILAARTSSFAQSMPFSMAFTKRSDRKTRDSWCEVSPDAKGMRCYSEVMDWCCKGTSGFVLDGILAGYEHARLPLVNVAKENFTSAFIVQPISFRTPEPGKRYKEGFLPFSWADVNPDSFRPLRKRRRKPP